VRSWRGEQPGVLYVHATGFSKELWAPVVDALSRKGAAPAGWAIDQRGHGDSSMLATPMDWSDLSRDVAGVLESIVNTPVVGVGHSSGGAALAMAAIEDPAAFEHLILIEPIIFPPPHQRIEDHPMSVAAEARRSSFPDRKAAVEHFSGKGPFAGWAADAIAAYVDGALRDTGNGLVLKCSPQTEAEHYRSGSAHATWDHLDEIANPVTLIVGSQSTTHHGAYLAALTERFRDAEMRSIPNASHLVPMERPDVVADAIEDARSRG